MLKANNVSYCIDNRYLLKNISLEFKPGEFTVIMGQNGAGKSTLLRLLAGSTKATEGEITLFDKDIKSYKEIELARMRAVLSQHYEISFPVTIRDIVMMGRYPHFKSEPAKKDIEIIDKTLTLMGIENLKERSYDTLSGGEAQKVQMARVLSQIWQHENNNDKILFLDEPVSQLDIQYQYFMLQVAKKFTKENVMVIAVLHDLNLALAYADNIVFLKNGELVSKFDSIYDIDKKIVNDVFNIEMENIPNPFSDKPHFIVKNEMGL
ncbi:MAG: heme ABC transporter ATP-binding protein [Ignavibacteria bacterium]|nr:heme ABC transporter ATP-binding protein [Ignavibacteria bacterium]